MKALFRYFSELPVSLLRFRRTYTIDKGASNGRGNGLRRWSFHITYACTTIRQVLQSYQQTKTIVDQAGNVYNITSPLCVCGRQT